MRRVFTRNALTGEVVENLRVEPGARLTRSARSELTNRPPGLDLPTDASRRAWLTLGRLHYAYVFGQPGLAQSLAMTKALYGARLRSG